MKILFHCPALWCNTGYAVQSKRIIPHLVKAGHEVVVSASGGLENAAIEWQGIIHLPRGNKVGGWDIVPMHYSKTKSDLLITVHDNWIMPPKVYSQLNWVPWFPVDEDPLSPALIRSLVDSYGKPYTKAALVYSQWGQKMLEGEGIKSLYMPESVDTEVYTDQGQEKCKKELGFRPQDFVVGMVAANHGYPPRKAFDRNLIGFAKFAEKHKEARLYIHTNYDESWQNHDAVDLIGYIKMLSKDYPVLQEKGRIQFPDQYALFLGISDKTMAKVYSGFDVLLAATCAEGFGLPIIEAQSCGVPVVVTDFSSMPELVGAGWKVKPGDYFITGRLSKQVWPDEDDIAAKLEEAYQAIKKDPNELATKARLKALEFDSEKIVKDYWLPFLNNLKI